MCTNCEWADALAAIKDCHARIADLPEAGEDFGEGCAEKLESMQEWIKQHEHVTDRMVDAIDGVSRALSRWHV